MEPGISIASFMRQVKEVVNKMTANSDKPSVVMIVERVLTALPTMYDGVRRAIGALDTVPTLEQLTGHLQLEEARKNN
ncbi:hypothetical protein R1flu_014213 [Riccia fluitans]|uniref:Uncharacterized protein n=1 Tax=Riccia fluitans TaxID=41844 RepID=A0ABD1YJ71_9MARC